ncbi:MAG: hypothetical protein J6S53_07305 [Lentisphaeria bacterium]|nr:hypothetical protein [Lentisphaeria bacterium]
MEKTQAVFRDSSIEPGTVFHIKHMENISPDGKGDGIRKREYDLFVTAEESNCVKIINFPGKYLLSWQDKENCEHLETFYLK